MPEADGITPLPLDAAAAYAAASPPPDAAFDLMPARAMISYAARHATICR